MTNAVRIEKAEGGYVITDEDLIPLYRVRVVTSFHELVSMLERRFKEKEKP